MNPYILLGIAILLSAISAWFSIAGLAALYAGSVLSIVIMGIALEAAKITTAAWLHLNWKTIPFMMKAYFSVAVIILAFITSMGVFGYLSKAHIEQTGSAAEISAQLETNISKIAQIDEKISSLQEQIKKEETQNTSTFNAIQAKIDSEQSNIDSVYARYSEETTQIKSVIDTLRNDYTAVDSVLSSIDRLPIRELQTLVGLKPDGSMGPKTREAVAQYKAKLNNELSTISAKLAAAQDDYSSLQAKIDEETKSSKDVIEKLRAEITVDTKEIDLKFISDSEQKIEDFIKAKDELISSNIELETKQRKLQNEVGPIRYVANFIYGETSDELLEKSVVWMNIIIVSVFDPLAILLTLAALKAIHTRPITFTNEEVFSGVPEIKKPRTKKAGNTKVVKPIPADSRNIKYHLKK